MGMIYDDFGVFSIEGRRESFYIHASYGFKPLERRLGDLKLGQRFQTIIDDDKHYVVGHLIGDMTLVRDLPPSAEGEQSDLSSDLIVLPIDKNGDPVDQMEDDHPLGSVWRDHPHPEIDNNDLDDLISALEDYRARLKAK